MKIAIPVNEKTLNSNVYQSFGRTPYFLIYDVETKESVYLDNDAVYHQGGAGIKAAQNIIDHKVKAIITPRCGTNAAEVFQAASIKMYQTINMSIRQNIEAFIEGKLPLLENLHTGYHHHGGR